MVSHPYGLRFESISLQLVGNTNRLSQYNPKQEKGCINMTVTLA